MAYSSTANPLSLLVTRPGGQSNVAASTAGGLGGQIFTYNSTDLMGTIAAVGYFTDAQKWGARAGDILFATAWSTAVPAVYVGHSVGRFISVSSTGGTVVFASSST